MSNSAKCMFLSKTDWIDIIYSIGLDINLNINVISDIVVSTLQHKIIKNENINNIDFYKFINYYYTIDIQFVYSRLNIFLRTSEYSVVLFFIGI